MGNVNEKIYAVQDALGFNQNICDAARLGDVQRLRTHLEEPGVDIEERDPEGLTPLLLACREGHEACARLLIDRGAKQTRDTLGMYPIHHAAQNDDVEILDLLLKSHADVNARNSMGITPLHWSAIWNAPRAMEMLLKHGADIERRQQNNQTPLHLAALHGSHPCIEILMHNGCNMDVVDSDNATPLDVAMNDETRGVILQCEDRRQQQLKIAVS